MFCGFSIYYVEETPYDHLQPPECLIYYYYVPVLPPNNGTVLQMRIARRVLRFFAEPKSIDRRFHHSCRSFVGRYSTNNCGTTLAIIFVAHGTCIEGRRYCRFIRETIQVSWTSTTYAGTGNP
jgi:hypothetical protein